MSSAIAFMGDNAIQIQTSEAYSTLQKSDPRLLFPNEQIHLAFQGRGGKGRDNIYLTNLRVLLRDVKGISGKQKEYRSVPYKSLKAFSVETAGSLDGDVELKLYGSDGIGEIKLDFVSGKVDILGINKFLASVVFEDVIPTDTSMPTTSNTSSGFFGSFSDNSSQIDASYVREKYHQVFLENEEVELAFQCGRDMTILTSKRMIQVDVQGLSGSKIEFLSIRWNCIRAYTIETAGRYDRDVDIMLFTNLGKNRTRIEMDLKKSTCDVHAVQKYFADKMLGVDYTDESFQENVAVASSHNVVSWFGDDNMAIDPVQMDEQFHSNPPLLQKTERVEMAFKGRRDILLFTSKRLLIIDFKGISGTKVEYVTIPWKTIQAFGVRSAGSLIDKDCEVFVWTDFYDVYFPPKQNENDPPPPPIPRFSFLEFDFKNKAVDLMAMQRYLSERCLRLDNHELLPVQEFTGSSSGISPFIAWLGGDFQEIDAVQLNQQLQTTQTLTKDENVIMAFKSGRDTTAFTNKRILTIDVKGISGSKIEWRSIPHTSIRAFSAESAGSWDTDSELKVYCKNYWDHEAVYPYSKYKFDFKKGRADIIAIQNLLTHYVVGSTDGASTTNIDTYEYKQDTSTFESFTSWITNDAKAIDPKYMNEKLHSSPNILYEDEVVDHVYKVGRDIIVFTTKRILYIDRQGYSGKKVEYMTYPLRYCAGYSVKSSGSVGFMKPPEVQVFTDIPGKAEFSQELEKGKDEMWNLQSMLGMKLLDMK